MANNKAGFDFYRVDTDRYQDIRIKRLKKELGCVGVAVYDYILCEIYRVKGCFLEWDESTAFDVSEYFGLKESVVNEVVGYCCAVGLFDKELLASGNVLSSRSIQSRYLEMCRIAKRKNSGILEKYRIIPEECSKVPEVSRKNTEESPHSIVEYSIEENSKEYTPSIPLTGDSGGRGGNILKLESEKKEGKTHNLTGLLRRLEILKVLPTEVNTICKLSENGLIGHEVWVILDATDRIAKQSKTGLHSPGKFIIQQLREGMK